uniref:transposase n=1 Tax=Candidatus Enterovibrio escicola TaxID=1927127 RepID=UPI0034DADD5A
MIRPIIFGITLLEIEGHISSPLKKFYTTKWCSLITNTGKNMKLKVMKLWNRLMLRQKYIILTVFDQLSNIPKIKHFRHQSWVRFMVNLITGFIAYTF